MVVFAGTFDPITKGHEQVINVCVKKYGSCLVVVGENSKKEPFFSLDERVSFLQQTFVDNSNVKVVKYADYKDNYGDFLLEIGVNVYVRGIRNRADLKYERAYAKQNKKIYPKIKTKYIKVKQYKEISSTLVKELLQKGENVDDYLPTKCLELIKKTFLEKVGKQ